MEEHAASIFRVEVCSISSCWLGLDSSLYPLTMDLLTAYSITYLHKLAYSEPSHVSPQDGGMFLLDIGKPYKCYNEATRPTQQKDQGAKLITEGRSETTWTKNS
jgi:hypothetical protein